MKETIDLQTPEQIVAHCETLSAKELAAILVKLSHDQLSEVIGRCGEGLKGSIGKLCTIFSAAENKDQIETIGKVLSLEQTLIIIHFLSKERPKDRWKLAPLLVGMSNGIFRIILQEADEGEIKLFKDELLAEPIQHQLTLSLHHVEFEIDNFATTIQLLEREIASKSIEEYALGDFEQLIKSLNVLPDTINKLIGDVSKLLSLAWNFGRVDLVEKLGKAKEACFHMLNHYIGHPSAAGKSATGLHLMLESKLASIYGNLEDPVIEGLANLSIWYLEDYWDMGLLPTVKDRNELALHRSSKKTESTHAKHLFAGVQANLEKIGLKTVKDLTSHGIYSKPALAEYIQRNSEKLIS